MKTSYLIGVASVATIVCFSSRPSLAQRTPAGYVSGTSLDRAFVNYQYTYQFQAHLGEGPFTGGGSFQLTDTTDEIVVLNETLKDIPSVHGSESYHKVAYKVLRQTLILDGMEFKKAFDWRVGGTALAQGQCKEDPEFKCGDITAITKIQATKTFLESTQAIITYGIGEGTQFRVGVDEGVFDPSFTLAIDGIGTFFSVNIFDYDASVPGINASFSFGPISSDYNITLFYNDLSCQLASCASDTEFINALASIYSSGPGGSWTLDADAGFYYASKNILLPGFAFDNLLTTNLPGQENDGQLYTLRVSGESPDSSGEDVPGPLPLLGVGAAFGYSRKLRKRIKSSKLPVASTID